MSELFRVPVTKEAPEESRSRVKARTLKDTFLISAWVAGYAGVPMLFRAARAVETLSSSKPDEARERGEASAANRG